jgi:hypothetical protein
MNLSQALNLNTATQTPLFEPTYLNLEYIFQKILDFFRSFFGFFIDSEFLRVLLFLLLFLFLFVIAYSIIRVLDIRERQKEHLKNEIDEYAQHQAELTKPADSSEYVKNPRWGHVLDYLKSENPNDWKLSIIEADSMLDDLTVQLKLGGENLGERLKTADKDKFKTLDNAWEAHLVRNRIAHEGSQFEVSQREANRVITLYENVFHEFGYI